MKLGSHINLFILGILMISSGIFVSCDAFNESLPECRLFVKFKYDYNMQSVCSFHKQVDKVELYVFDKDGKFLFQQAEEGEPLTTGNYLMNVELPVGEYKLMAWAGVHDSYDLPELAPGALISTLELKLKREASLVIDKELEPLWYGEIMDVHFTGETNQVETINLIKNTNKISFIFQFLSNDDPLNLNDYEYEIIESNGYMNHLNQLKEDDVLSYHPYYKEQMSTSAVRLGLNTMRLMKERQNRLVVTEKATGEKVFNVSLSDYFAKTQEPGSTWDTQEYFDRQDAWHIVFYLNASWVAVKININGWTWYSQEEIDEL
ncbi:MULTISPECIES: FimB/Mfa2 family fimbrial subunit [Butyricimonas]|uniref:FimB/Mfa2 family fimbrial subunit n=1 Tax=Butyricimonas TaxID=574697 RepID=UPI001D099DBD|nr:MULTISPECIES: FimB/Mfa2 family fimbrial subunit [Butyricimonas]MCB6972812.1 FimB/Mfa2 family fimbrial subunit [Butyricimonas synergistica]MCG4519820.1 FimB/Mfa2 family fimbrial subunit [Butyricimonas sp. DFI.6.44]